MFLALKATSDGKAIYVRADDIVLFGSDLGDGYHLMLRNGHTIALEEDVIPLLMRFLDGAGMPIRPLKRCERDPQSAPASDAKMLNEAWRQATRGREFI